MSTVTQSSVGQCCQGLGIRAPGGLVNTGTHLPIQQVWIGAWICAFLPEGQLMMMLLVTRPYFRCIPHIPASLVTCTERCPCWKVTQSWSFLWRSDEWQCNRPATHACWRSKSLLQRSLFLLSNSWNAQQHSGPRITALPPDSRGISLLPPPPLFQNHMNSSPARILVTTTLHSPPCLSQPRNVQCIPPKGLQDHLVSFAWKRWVWGII